MLVLVCPPKRYAHYSLRSYADGLAIRTVVEVISVEITVISYREFIAGWFVYKTYIVGIVLRVVKGLGFEYRLWDSNVAKI